MSDYDIHTRLISKEGGAAEVLYTSHLACLGNDTHGDGLPYLVPLRLGPAHNQVPYVGVGHDGLTSRNGKKWANTAIHSVLRNEAYTGTLVWGRSNRSGMVRVENAWPAIVGRETFDKAQGLLKARAPGVMQPRRLVSEHLLSGLIKCGICGTAMIGHAAKSGRFFYYRCGNAFKQGSDVCNSRLVPKGRIESFIVDKIRNYILTAENLTELVRLTGRELDSLVSDEREHLRMLEAQIREVDFRLEHLYDALERGSFSSDELAPRIRRLRDKRAELETAKQIELPGIKVIKEYVDDLRALLGSAPIVEQRVFLKSFIDEIKIGAGEVTINYTLPMPPQNLLQETVGVLPFIRDGGAYGIRTRDLRLERAAS